MITESKTGSLRAWLQLMRPPNLITVPGDPLAGFLVAGMYVEKISLISVLPVLISAVLLYISGLILNDVADFKEDLMYRPERPLPSGDVSRRQALAVGLFLMTAGIGSAAWGGMMPAVTAACLAVLILFYNFVTRRSAVLGVFNMGLCRGTSVLLGASVAGMFHPMVLIVAAGVTFFIMEVSVVALCEAEGKIRKGSRWLPAFALFIFFATFFLRLGKLSVAGLILASAAVIWCVLRGRALGSASDGKGVSQEVGMFLRGQLIVQAAVCSSTGFEGIVAAVCLLLICPVGIVLSRSFYSS